MLSLASRPAKTITVAALAGAAFALAYKATSRYLGGADEEDGNLDDEVRRWGRILITTRCRVGSNSRVTR